MYPTPTNVQQKPSAWQKPLPQRYSLLWRKNGVVVAVCSFWSVSAHTSWIKSLFSSILLIWLSKAATGPQVGEAWTFESPQRMGSFDSKKLCHLQGMTCNSLQPKGSKWSPDPLCESLLRDRPYCSQEAQTPTWVPELDQGEELNSACAIFLVVTSNTIQLIDCSRDWCPGSVFIIVWRGQFACLLKHTQSPQSSNIDPESSGPKNYLEMDSAAINGASSRDSLCFRSVC